MGFDPTHSFVIWAMAIALAVAIVGLIGFRHLAGARWGRMALLVAVALLPLSVSFAGLQRGVAESSRTRFCLSCHEMQEHGKSLFVDDRRALAALHYQRRLVDRDQVCYSCHKDYAMFGGVKAKLNGLRHVWAHYTGQIPDKFALYERYSNSNCLHCHEDARRFVESEPHKPFLTRLSSGEVSCLSCHKTTHDMAKVKAGELWGGP